MSFLCSIQNAHVASHLFPSLTASGRTLCSSRLFSTGLSSPPWILAMAMASCMSFMRSKHTFTASFRLPANRKNAAAYSSQSLAKVEEVRASGGLGGYSNRTGASPSRHKRSSWPPFPTLVQKSCLIGIAWWQLVLCSRMPCAIAPPGRFSFSARDSVMSSRWDSFRMCSCSGS